MAEVGVAADPLQIFLAFDPDTQLPSNFAWDPKARPIKIAGDKTIVELTQAVKGVISAHCFDNGFAEFDLIVNVAWNSKSDKPVRPQNTVASEFEDGDTICVIAEMWKAKECVATESSKLPVTILTGFLGAGKTTLLNYILQEQRGKKIAIIENEFGEVSIDDDLLKMNKFALAEEVVVMDNGCMCCTVRGDLEKGLRQIITQRRKGKHIDAILIETTGNLRGERLAAEVCLPRSDGCDQQGRRRRMGRWRAKGLQGRFHRQEFGPPSNTQVFRELVQDV